MKTPQTTLNKQTFFAELGFNEYESKALASLVELKIANAKQLSEHSKVPQNKLYQIIKNFQALGILSQVPDETKKYQLINIQSFIKSRLKENEEKLKKLKSSSKIIDKLKTNTQGTNFNFSLLLGQQTIMTKLAETNKEVKKEILGVQRNWKIWADGLRAMQTSIKKGVKVKIIGIINNETKERAIEYKKLGCKVKAYNKKFGEYPLRFTIFDNKTARITIGKPEISNPKDYITIFTDSKPLISMLRNQFMQMWKESQEF
jgi:sugar-specific transcriptional regulator TrmB